MQSERSHIEHPSAQVQKDAHEAKLHRWQTNSQENILATLALLLGPKTDYATRVRATRRLARQGPALLPLLLTTLSNYPEITTPAWPWWPPQYEHCSRLLIHLSQSAHLRLETLLQHPTLAQPNGPVLWTSVIEAASLPRQAGQEASYETLFCGGLTAPWVTVRYAAAMALAKLAGKTWLLKTTVDALSASQDEEEAIPVRLAASCALLRNSVSSGLTALLRLLEPDTPGEARKAAVFILATELPVSSPGFLTHLPSSERERLLQLLLLALQDQNGEIGLHAARALRTVAVPSTLSSICSLLDSAQPQMQITTLTALEELAHRDVMRRILQHFTLLSQVVVLLSSVTPEVRKQASYTLAAIGGEYAAAVLGTTILNTNHPGYIEALEGLRLLHDALRSSTRRKVVRWLLGALQEYREAVKITALDSLAYLAWQARTRRHKMALDDMSAQIFSDRSALQLLTCQDAWVRQRSVELLSMLSNQPGYFHRQLLQLLHADTDSGVRACVAFTLGQIGARWAIPDLLQTLLDPDKHVAETALNALGSLASPDDAIVVYVLQEVARCGSTRGNDAHPLARSAHLLLKKWRKATG